MFDFINRVSWNDQLYGMVATTLVSALVIILKMAINRKISGTLIIETILEIPTDIALLSLGYLMTFVINNGNQFAKGIVLFLTDLILIALIFILSRESIDINNNKIEKLKGSKEKVANFMIVFMNFMLSIFLYFSSISLFIER